MGVVLLEDTEKVYHETSIGDPKNKKKKGKSKCQT